MRSRVSTVAVVALALSCSAARAQEGHPDHEPGAAVDAAPEAPQVFGGAATLLQIPAAAFTVRDSTAVYQQDSFGYYYSTSSPSLTTFWAPVDLPAGAQIDRLGLYLFDNDPTNSISARLQQYDGTTSPTTSTTATVSSAPGTPMYAYSTAVVNHSVNNNASAGGHHYSVLIDLPVRSSLLRFKAVEIQYRRVVSAAPAVATFPNDVPTSHPMFRFVEALAASGITGGCGADSFCPDEAVTRGQMAVFLAAALGLHFPN